jgi:hypothetical protein
VIDRTVLPVMELANAPDIPIVGDSVGSVTNRDALMSFHDRNERVRVCR